MLWSPALKPPHIDTAATPLHGKVIILQHHQATQAGHVISLTTLKALPDFPCQ